MRVEQTKNDTVIFKSIAIYSYRVVNETTLSITMSLKKGIFENYNRSCLKTVWNEREESVSTVRSWTNAKTFLRLSMGTNGLFISLIHLILRLVGHTHVERSIALWIQKEALGFFNSLLLMLCFPFLCYVFLVVSY